MAWWVEATGYLAAVLVFAAFFMRTAINIRLVAVASNAAFIVYGTATGSMPILVLHSLLLPLNLRRLSEMRDLTRKVKQASDSDLKMEWLKSYMTRRSYRAGATVFAKGAPASEMFIVDSGGFLLPGLAMTLSAGDVVGELGILNPSQTRTDGLVCVEDGALLVLSYDDLRVLYFQNPEFGFYFLKLTSRRMFANMERLEKELMTLRAGHPVERGVEAAS